MIMESIYMDYNATTPVRSEVLELMDRVQRECFGNPSSIHSPGRQSKACLEDARCKIAESLGADPDEIVFTAGGSESDNLAIKGVAAMHKSGHVVTTCIEHSAVRGSCDWLREQGYDVSCVPVGRLGVVDPGVIEDTLRDDTILITVMWANNEAGQIQPIEEIARIARDRDIVFHTDAVQAFGKVPVNVREVPVDLLAISGHKLYAPKGVGALYVRAGVEIAKQVHGCSQEMGRRAGTENIAGFAAFGEACMLAVRDMQAEGERLRALRDELEKRILEEVPDTIVSGDRERRVPNTTNIAFRGIESGSLIRELDELGIAVSGASAGASGKSKPSAVLMEGMGLTREEAVGALRLSLGRFSEASHIDRLLEVLPGVVGELRRASAKSPS